MRRLPKRHIFGSKSRGSKIVVKMPCICYAPSKGATIEITMADYDTSEACQGWGNSADCVVTQGIRRQPGAFSHKVDPDGMCDFEVSRAYVVMSRWADGRPRTCAVYQHYSDVPTWFDQGERGRAGLKKYLQEHGSLKISLRPLAKRASEKGVARKPRAKPNMAAPRHATRGANLRYAISVGGAPILRKPRNKKLAAAVESAAVK